MEALESFLQALQQSGKLSDDERSQAIDLARQIHSPPLEQFTIPGAITFQKPCSFREMAAAAAVFNTAELAEQIFSHLSAADLANGIAITCRGFHSYVYSSPCLRRKMFLEPDYTISEMDPVCPKLKDVHYLSRGHYINSFVTQPQDLMKKHPRLRETYILQPPPTEAKISYETEAGHVYIGEVHRPSGFTYGTLWDLINSFNQTWQRSRGKEPRTAPLRVLEACFNYQIPEHSP